jgi:hypothetical protein
LVCAFTYGLGGILAVWIIGNELIATTIYVLRNSAFRRQLVACSPSGDAPYWRRCS